MRPLSMRSVMAANRQQPRLLLHCISRKALSSSSIRFEEGKPIADLERQKGVPLAYELGGISISKSAPGQRLTLTQRLEARHAKQQAKAGDSPDATSEKRSYTIDDKARASSIRGTPRLQGTTGSAPRRTPEGRRDPERPSFQNAQRSASYGAQRKPQTGQEHPLQMHKNNANTRSANRGQGQGGFAKTSSRKKARGRPRRDAQSGSPRTIRSSDPDLNDYPNEDWNGPPTRRYDDEGLLKLKGEHAQLNPVVRPTLPKFATQPTMSTSAFARSKASAAGVLRTVSYLDRAPPKSVAEPSHNVLGVVDNADLALSRVRDLEVHQRRDALGIVQKMASPALSVGNEPAVRA